jgi:thymidine phosphorylase
VAAWRLGAGRARKEDDVNHAAGIVCLAKPGDEVAAGQPILELRTDDETRFGSAFAALDGATAVGAGPAAAEPLVIERITSD